MTTSVDKNHHMYGKHHTPSTKKKISIGVKLAKAAGKIYSYTPGALLGRGISSLVISKHKKAMKEKAKERAKARREEKKAARIASITGQVPNSIKSSPSYILKE